MSPLSRGRSCRLTCLSDDLSFIGVGAQATLGTSRFYQKIYVRKISKIPECYMIFARNIPEFYMINARKYFSPFFFWGGGGGHVSPLPPYPTPMLSFVVNFTGMTRFPRPGRPLDEPLLLCAQSFRLQNFQHFHSDRSHYRPTSTEPSSRRFKLVVAGHRWNFRFANRFLPCDAVCTVSVIVILSVRPSVCPSVCLSHSWTVSTWFDLRS